MPTDRPMKLTKNEQQEVVNFVENTVSSRYGFVDYIDQSYQLETGWWVHLQVTKEPDAD